MKKNLLVFILGIQFIIILAGAFHIIQLTNVIADNETKSAQEIAISEEGAEADDTGVLEEKLDKLLTEIQSNGTDISNMNEALNQVNDSVSMLANVDLPGKYTKLLTEKRESKLSIDNGYNNPKVILTDKLTVKGGDDIRTFNYEQGLSSMKFFYNLSGSLYELSNLTRDQFTYEEQLEIGYMDHETHMIAVDNHFSLAKGALFEAMLQAERAKYENALLRYQLGELDDSGLESAYVDFYKFQNELIKSAEALVFVD